MHEIRFGVIPDPAGSKRQGDTPQLKGLDAGHADVDRLPVDMQALGGNTAVAAVKGGVGPGRAVAGDHVQGVRGVKAQGKRVQEIQQAGCDRADLAGAVIPQDVVDLRQCPCVVPAVRAVAYIQPLAGVGVEKGEPLFRRG